MSEGGVTGLYVGLARRFSRRGFLGTVGIGATAGVAAVLTRMGVGAPPVFAASNCTAANGPCHPCASIVHTISPDTSCYCRMICVCYKWEQGTGSCGRAIALLLCCNNCIGNVGACIQC